MTVTKLIYNKFAPNANTHAAAQDGLGYAAYCGTQILNAVVVDGVQTDVTCPRCLRKLESLEPIVEKVKKTRKKKEG